MAEETRLPGYRGRGGTTQTYFSIGFSIGLTRAGACKEWTDTSRRGSLTTSPTTVCENSGQCVRHSCLQYRDPTGNSTGPFPVHPVHCRFLPPITPQPSSKILWRLCYQGCRQGWGRQSLQSTYWGPPPSQRGEDQSAGVGFLQAQTDNHLDGGEHPGNRHEMVTSYNYLGVHIIYHFWFSLSGHIFNTHIYFL